MYFITQIIVHGYTAKTEGLKQPRLVTSVAATNFAKLS